MGSSVPQRMTCIEISEPGGPEVLKPATRPTPTPGPVSRENLLDRMIRAGRFASGLVEVRALFTAARRAG